MWSNSSKYILNNYVNSTIKMLSSLFFTLKKYINLLLLDEDGPGQMAEIREVHMLDPWWSFYHKSINWAEDYAYEILKLQ